GNISWHENPAFLDFLQTTRLWSKSASKFICMHARPANHRRGRDLPPPISAQALRAPRERGGTMYQGHWTLVVSARCSRPMGDGRADHICGLRTRYRAADRWRQL